ncbi:nitroreductase family protein [Nocardioides sp. T2.26MG-1]|uniref:nitroreductase family protein n=1 Tax=Nocardioides sp. T2.26MG-1 TaxID=3041166 RepID=UPI0024774273|nr:nitroreductase family protein [Nocardioides sp. T2.26MG-1]CAI9414817.1 malonic semialdehyde reductase RutE [Nocardioides sp. T2.26MG-1]
MDLYDVMRTTPAVREFTDAPLPEDVLHRILDHARFAPSGGNRQGTRIVVVRDQGTRRRLAALNEPAVRRYVAQAKAGQSPWNPLEPPSPSAEEIAATAVPEPFTRPLLTAAVVLVVWVDLGLVAATDQDLDRIGLVAGASVYPLVWNLLLAARNEGYGGTITTMAVAEEPAVRELLHVPDRFALAAVVPLGKPVREVTRLRRRSVEELATWETFDGPPLAASSPGQDSSVR